MDTSRQQRSWLSKDACGAPASGSAQWPPPDAGGDGSAGAADAGREQGDLPETLDSSDEAHRR
eukprot:11161745-Lingulodinium_polyedra.AAC.1